MRTYFVNFVGLDMISLGCAVVEVSEDEFHEHYIQSMSNEQKLLTGHDFDLNDESTKWLLLIMLKIKQTGCSPKAGQGHLAVLRLDTLPQESFRKMEAIPKHVFISAEESEQYGLVTVKTKVVGDKLLQEDQSIWDLE